MRTVAIAGVGLIGGSFGLALRQRGFPGRILGISSPKTIETAVRRGAIDAGVSLEEAAAEADVLLLAQPISVILDTIRKLIPLARPDLLVTDAGSTKRRICAAGADLPAFLGGHPMAGKETAGVASADSELFVDRPWVFCVSEAEVDLTPHASEFLSWVKRCGSIPVFLKPCAHDKTVALTSHLPQLASTALGVTIQAQDSHGEMVAISGSGLRDMTRLALSSWAVWKDIVESNTDFIEHVLQVYIDTLTEMRENLQTQRTGEQFDVAAQIATRIRRGKQND